MNLLRAVVAGATLVLLAAGLRKKTAHDPPGPAAPRRILTHRRFALGLLALVAFSANYNFFIWTGMHKHELFHYYLGSKYFPELGYTELYRHAYAVAGAAAVEPCRIRVIDESNDWPVPLVELKTTHNVRFVSDNAGMIAFDLPELMNTETWFHVEGHGYSVKKDGFGYSGVRLVPRPNETLTVKVRRQLPAKRLGRITGGGLFAESQKLGEMTDWTEQRILGCDSVQNAVHGGKLFLGLGRHSAAELSAWPVSHDRSNDRVAAA